MKNLQLEEFAIEGAGGGGCFLPGTQIMVPEGFKNIEDIQIGDKVICYAEEGVPFETPLAVGTVYKTSKHPKEDNNANLYIITAGETTLQVTGNHFLQSVLGTFVYAANFEVGDGLVLCDGTTSVITSIEERPIAEGEFVYNFEVDPHHTYIANGIRVHNGGGGSSKSAGGGTARAAKEAPNTLSSSASAVVMEVLSEGEIVGLVNGAKSIYFDGTPVQNDDSTYNYNGFMWDIRVGLPNQTPMPGFPDVESVNSVNIEVSTAQGPVERLLASDTDAARVTILVPTLYIQDPSNGDLNAYSFGLAIDRRLGTSGAWMNALTKTVSGKTMSPYEESYRIERPAGTTGAWQIRVRRTTSDDSNANAHSAFRWSHYTEIKDKQLAYNNTAYVGIKVDAKSTGGNLPKRSYRVKGIKVQVPTNYNPTTRVYTGSWNGQFKYAWTDNPAWIVYDLLTNARYGLGNVLGNTDIDQYSFYDAARYNDELVSDGNGGTEPRFTFNAVINTRQDAWKLVQAVASSCRAVVYYGGGKARLIQDRPTATSVIVNKTDVINGMFEYASTSIQQRHPVVSVTFNDKTERYATATVTCEDAEGIDRYGYTVKETAAYGATTEGQARRLGLWTLYTELGTTESVKFSTGLNLATRIAPGNVIKVMDADLRGAPFGGRIAASTVTSVTLDRDVSLIVGQNYVFEYVDADGKTIRSAAVTNAKPYTGRTLTFAAQPAAPQIGNSWIITSQDFEGRLFRVYSVVEHAAAEFEVTAFAYDPNKYVTVDQVTNPESWKPFQKDLSYCPAPSNLVWSRETTTDSYGRRMVNLRLNWDQTDKDYISNYLVSFRRDGREITNNLVTAHSEFIIPNAQAGTYEAFIYAVNLSNVRSPAAVSNYYNDLSGGISPMVAPLNLQVKGGGTNWNSKDLTFTWDQNPGNTNTGDGIFKSFYIELVDAVTDTVFRSISDITDTSYTYTFEYNRVDNGGENARRSIKVRVYNMDSYNRTSQPVTATLTNPVPAAPTIEVVGGYQAGNIAITPPNGIIDLAGYVVAVVPTALDMPTEAMVVYKGPNPVTTVPTDATSLVFRAACYDMLSDTFADLMWSDAAEATVSQIIATVDSVENYKFYGLLFKPNHPSTNQISWAQAGVARTNDGASHTIPSGNLTWTGTALYVYYDWASNTIQGSNTLGGAIGIGKALIGTYYGGRTFSGGTGDAYIDGSKILAQTVGAAQIVAGSITANEIAAEAITTGTIASGAITADKITTATAVITSELQIADALIKSAKIGDLQVTTLKIANNAVTTSAVDTHSTNVNITTNYSGNQGTVPGGGQLIDTTYIYGEGYPVVTTVNLDYLWDDGMPLYAGTDLQVQGHTYGAFRFDIYNESTGSVVKSYYQIVGKNYATQVRCQLFGGGAAQAAGYRNEVWQVPFYHSFLFNATAGVTYRLECRGFIYEQTSALGGGWTLLNPTPTLSTSLRTYQTTVIRK